MLSFGISVCKPTNNTNNVHIYRILTVSGTSSFIFLPLCLILFKYHFQAYITTIKGLNCVDFIKFSSFLFIKNSLIRPLASL